MVREGRGAVESGGTAGEVEENEKRARSVVFIPLFVLLEALHCILFYFAASSLFLNAKQK